MTVPHHLVLHSLTHPDVKQQAINDLICVAFYYLLRVGEHTYSPPKQRRRTQRFRVRDVIFRRRDHTIIPNTAPLAELYLAHSAALCISNQKNGVRGQCIHNECTGQATSPVRALARRVAHIMAHTANPNTALSSYYTSPAAAPQQVVPKHINAALKQAVQALGLHHCGFTPDKVSSHSLRAGGAMAMHLNGESPITIKKQGRWSSDTFTTYIHTQIGALMAGVSKRMLNFIPFHTINSTGPIVIPPAITI